MNAKKVVFVVLGIIAVLIGIGCFVIGESEANSWAEIGPGGEIFALPIWIAGIVSFVSSCVLFRKAAVSQDEEKLCQGSQSEHRDKD